MIFMSSFKLRIFYRSKTFKIHQKHSLHSCMLLLKYLQIRYCTEGKKVLNYLNQYQVVFCRARFPAGHKGLYLHGASGRGLPLWHSPQTCELFTELLPHKPLPDHFSWLQEHKLPEQINEQPVSAVQQCAACFNTSPTAVATEAHHSSPNFSNY